MRNVLLVEPNFKNKYPPIGLMKLSTYHKMLGDHVVFYKGEPNQFILDLIVDKCVTKLYMIDGSVNWKSKYFEILDYIKTRKLSLLENLELKNSKYEILLLNALNYYKAYYWGKEYVKEISWDRIYISTLFTFYWDITIKTIIFFKQFIKNDDDLWVGGVMASVIPKEIQKVTGIKNIHIGLLNKPGILDKNSLIIDDLPLDYSILDEINYQYPESNAFYGYTTRGCVRKCPFCAVPIIEPRFNKYISIKANIASVIETYGEKKNLLLLDNNVLASNCFPKIIKDIKEIGFDGKQKYIEPNHFEITIRNLKSGFNDRAYINKSIQLLNDLLKKVKQDHKQELYNLLSENNLLAPQTASKGDIIKVYPVVNSLFEKHRNKIPKNRYVDFNQGVDARFINEKNAKLLSQIPIRPLRIAFDSWSYKDIYLNAITLSKNYGIKHFSNYLLYNYDDKPVDLYKRLRLNVELCEEYKIEIYSFPMKYHPIFGDYKLNRDFVGHYWNKKYIRAVQIILNATKGKIGKGQSFFFKAFGKNEEEFLKLLLMPEAYIFYRFFFEKEGYVKRWLSDFNALSDPELKIALNIIEKNDFKTIKKTTVNSKLSKFLDHYRISRNQITKPKTRLSILKAHFDKLDKEEKYSVLLTADFSEL